MHHRPRTTLRLAAASAVFAVGFLCGSITQRPAQAQLGEMGKGAMEKAGEQGGALGSAAKLGTSITEMQEHVAGLQKNIDTLKQIQSALGG